MKRNGKIERPRSAPQSAISRKCNPTQKLKSRYSNSIRFANRNDAFRNNATGMPPRHDAHLLSINAQSPLIGPVAHWTVCNSHRHLDVTFRIPTNSNTPPVLTNELSTCCLVLRNTAVVHTLSGSHLFVGHPFIVSIKSATLDWHRCSEQRWSVFSVLFSGPG